MMKVLPNPVNEPVAPPTNEPRFAADQATPAAPPAERVNKNLRLDHSVIDYALTELKNSWLVLQANAARYTDALVASTSSSNNNAQVNFEAHLANHRAVFDLSLDLLRRLDILSPWMTRLSLSSADEAGHLQDLQNDKSGDPEYQLNDSLRRLATILEKGMLSAVAHDESINKQFSDALTELRLLYQEMKSLALSEKAATQALRSEIRQSAQEPGATTIEPLFFHDARLYQKLSNNMHTVHFKPDSPEIPLEGVTVSPHPPERIHGMVENGARIITYSTPSKEVVAHAIFFTPADADRQNPEFMRKLGLYSPAAFIHSLFVSEEAAGQVAYRKLVMASLTALQYSNAAYLAGVVHQDNWRGITTHLGIGSVNIVASAELTINGERFFPCILPVAPDARKEVSSAPISARRMAKELQQKRLPGLFPQNWQENAATWLKNYHLHTWVSQKLNGELPPRDRTLYLRNLKDLRYEMQGFETRVSMLEGGRNLLHYLRTGKQVPEEVWKQIARGQLANHGKELSKDQMITMLEQARDPTLVRITGGCGLLEHAQWKGMLKLFREGFTGFGGGILVGGTRMLVKSGDQPTTVIRPGITEVPMEIRRECPDAVIGGLVLGSERYDTAEHTVLFDQNTWLLGEDKKYLTILNPEIDYFMYIDHSNLPADRRWDAEYLDAISITQEMCREDRPGLRRFDPLLLVYNGGATTQREVQAWCDLRWPVMLVKDSGRVADQLCNNRDFLSANPNVTVCPKDSESMNLLLKSRGIIPAHG